MEQMMGQMGAKSPQKPLMPRLLDAERLSERERQTLRSDAEQRVQAGLQRLDQGLRAFADAQQTQDAEALARAVGQLHEAVSLWETGTTVLQALSSSTPRPRETALTWFKTQMHLAPAPQEATARPWGLSWVHLGGMVALGLFATGAVMVYLVKVRQSLRLLDRLTHRRHDT
jgi:hypothetical protein